MPVPRTKTRTRPYKTHVRKHLICSWRAAIIIYAQIALHMISERLDTSDQEPLNLFKLASCFTGCHILHYLPCANFYKIVSYLQSFYLILHYLTSLVIFSEQCKLWACCSIILVLIFAVLFPLDSHALDLWVALSIWQWTSIKDFDWLSVRHLVH
jgi:hypothetical protein